MFSAFKKLANRNEGQNGQNGTQVSPGGVQSMASNLQKKFSKGCNYNMKIVIRGDKNTGKTCLLSRLQGLKFCEEYAPTEEIQVASINWSYKNTEDIVKVEVWDVVDVAKKRKKLTGLKVGAGEAEQFEPGLDAQFLDVYKQTHGVIFIFDITKPWTFEYVKRELDRVPASIPVLVLANFSDMSHHRQVTKLQISDYIENIKRDAASPAEVRWAESSLRNGFGLKFLHRFFNVPFLTLQRNSLIQQLEHNLMEIKVTQEELDVYMETEEADYSKFSEGMATKRRLAAEELAPSATRSIVVGQGSNSVEPHAESNSAITFSNRANQPSEPTTLPLKPSPEPSKLSPEPTKPSTEVAASMSGLGGARAPSKEASPAKPGIGNLDVENFVPEAGDFDNFLEEEVSVGTNNLQNGNGNIDSSDDEGDGNPMVSKFKDDVEFDDYEVEKQTPVHLNAFLEDNPSNTADGYDEL